VIVVPTEPEKRMPGFESWWDVPSPGVSGEDTVRNAPARRTSRSAASSGSTSSSDGRRPCPDPGSKLVGAEETAEVMEVLRAAT
jgi:hypothetical protein